MYHAISVHAANLMLILNVDRINIADLEREETSSNVDDNGDDGDDDDNNSNVARMKPKSTYIYTL